MNKILIQKCLTDGIWKEVINKNKHSNEDAQALFIDRDGTIIELVEYIDDPTKLKIIPEVIKIIRTANQSGLKVVMVTNQSGINRGYFDWNGFIAVQKKLIESCNGFGAWFDAIYACPAKPGELTEYRKPNPGMFLTAAHDLGLNLSTSSVLGDSVSDLEAGKRAGLCQGWLVPSGHGERDRIKALGLMDDSFKVTVDASYNDINKTLSKCQPKIGKT